MDDNRLISWYQSFGLSPFHQPDVRQYEMLQIKVGDKLLRKLNS